MKSTFTYTPIGIFRTNAIGVLTVELLRRNKTKLYVRGVDVIDGTPVLDIKPYLPHFDCRPEAGFGWLEEKKENTGGGGGHDETL